MPLDWHSRGFICWNVCIIYQNRRKGQLSCWFRKWWPCSSRSKPWLTTAKSLTRKLISWLLGPKGWRWKINIYRHFFLGFRVLLIILITWRFRLIRLWRGLLWREIKEEFLRGWKLGRRFRVILLKFIRVGRNWKHWRIDGDRGWRHKKLWLLIKILSPSLAISLPRNSHNWISYNWKQLNMKYFNIVT